CGQKTDIFRHGGGQRMSRELAVPYLGDVPLDPEVVASGDEGRPIVVSKPESAAAKAFRSIASELVKQLDAASGTVLQPFSWKWDSHEGAPDWVFTAIRSDGNPTTPIGFRRRDPRTLSVLWQDGRQDDVDVRDLRLACACALCVEEMTGKKVLDPKSI